MKSLTALLRPALASLAMLTSLGAACAQTGLITPDDARDDLDALYTGLAEADAGLFETTPLSLIHISEPTRPY